MIRFKQLLKIVGAVTLILAVLGTVILIANPCFQLVVDRKEVIPPGVQNWQAVTSWVRKVPVLNSLFLHLDTNGYVFGIANVPMCPAGFVEIDYRLKIPPAPILPPQ